MLAMRSSTGQPVFYGYLYLVSQLTGGGIDECINQVSLSAHTNMGGDLRPTPEQLASCSFTDGGIDGPLVNCLYPCKMEYLGPGMLTDSFGSLPIDADDWTAAVTLSYIWSLVPSLVVIVCAIVGLVRRTNSPLLVAILGGACSIINKMVSTRIAAAIDDKYSYRPLGSCLHQGKAMPSGHVTNAYGIWIWFLLETLSANGYGARQGWTAKQKACRIAMATIVLLPVLPARVGIYDHTWAQVIAGCVQGILFGAAFFACMQCCYRRAAFAIAKGAERILTCPGLAKRLTLSETYWPPDGVGDDIPLSPVAALPQ